MLRFFFVFLVAAIVISAGSLGWYKITKSPRPVPLTMVRDFLLTTPVGRQAAVVLGAENESGVEPVSIPQVAGAMAASVAASLQEHALQAVMSGVVGQIAKQYDGLPTDQKKQLESIICKSAATP